MQERIAGFVVILLWFSELRRQKKYYVLVCTITADRTNRTTGLFGCLWAFLDLPWLHHATPRHATPPHASRKSEILSKFLEEVLQLTKMPSKRMAGNLMQAWQAVANKPNAKTIPAFVVVVPQLLAAFASHSVTVSVVDLLRSLYGCMYI